MSWRRGVLSVAVLAVLAAFPWGPLFAWSPVHPGYREMHFSRVDLLYPEGMALDAGYRGVDQYVADVEAFHEISAPKKIKVVVCRNWSDCNRFATPFLGRPLAVTVTGTLIFVTPKTAAFQADIGELLRHEFSHAVLRQNHSLLAALRMRKQPWVAEGVAGIVAQMGATAPGRQIIRLPEVEFLSRAKKEALWPWKDWRFNYTGWIYFWNRQIERSGKQALLKFERKCYSDPNGCRTTCAEVYGTGLRQAVEEVQGEVRSGRVVAPVPGF